MRRVARRRPYMLAVTLQVRHCFPVCSGLIDRMRRVNGSRRDLNCHSRISALFDQTSWFDNSVAIMRTQSFGWSGGAIGVQMRFFSSSSVNVDSTNPMNAALNVG